jgi:hypothetical protein
MAQNQDLYGKSFDQRLQIVGSDVMSRDISPNRLITGEIVFEPLGSGVRVTARDEQHRVLWGYVGAKETVKQVHCLVAIYDTLQEMLGEELNKRGLYHPKNEDPIAAAMSAFDRLETTVRELRESLEVKKVTDATLKRARTFTKIISDADRQVTLDANVLRG